MTRLLAVLLAGTAVAAGPVGPPPDFCAARWRPPSGRIATFTVNPGPDGKAILSSRALPGEEFFGFGEVWNGSLAQRGKRLRMWVRTGTPDECCYVPFFISTAGYGLFVDTYLAAEFDMCASDPERWSVTVPTDEPVEIYLFRGTPKEVVSLYCSVTGRPPLPPRWSLSPWKWRNEYKSQAEVLEDAQMMRAHDIPCSVIFIDNPFQEHGRNSFEWERSRFPEPEAMTARLRELGYRYLVWTSPFTEPPVPNWEYGFSRGFFVRTEEGAPLVLSGDDYWVDFTSPGAYEWWKEQIKAGIRRLGVSGFKIDRGQSIPEYARFANGKTGREMHNEYSLLMVRVVWEACREELGGEFTLLPRAGAARSQRYSPGKWPGDLSQDMDPESGLPSAIIAGQSVGLAGFAFWGSDTGGFEGPPLDKETLIRWAAFSCFCPIMQLGGNAPHEPWNTEVFDEETVPLYRYWARLHEALVPYTWRYAVEAHETGLPIIRPLVLDFWDDSEALSRWDEYLYGDWLLVAPVHVPGAESRDVYLPEGSWRDFWKPERIVEGPALLEDEPAPLSRIPVFVRQGPGVTYDGETLTVPDVEPLRLPEPL